MAFEFSVVAFAIIVFCYITVSWSKVINISNGSELELFMCHTLSSDTTLHLYPGGNFVLQFNFCNVSDLHNITITGVEHVNITSVRPNVGFGFISVTNLTIENITFVNCGTEFYHHIPSLPASAPLYLSNNSAAVLLFMNCSDVVIDSVAITQYYGYAMVMLRVTGQFMLNNSIISGSNINAVHTSSENQIKNIGSGLLVYQYDTSSTTTSDIYINISHTHITNSMHVYNIKVCLVDMYINNRSYHNELQPAGGITLIYSQVHYNVTTNISHSSIEECGGVGIGAMLILHIDNAMYSMTILEHCTMSKNHIYLLPALLHCEGELIGIYYVTTRKMHYHNSNKTSRSTSLLMTTSKVLNHRSSLSLHMLAPSTIYIMSTYHQIIECVFSNVTFINNSASKTGVCIYAMKVYKSSKGLNIKLHDIKAMKNHQSGGQLTAGIFTFVSVSNATISASYPGSSYFQDNSGSVISTYNSIIYLSGHLTFINNIALNGAALKLQGYSKVFLMPGLKANFESNTAINSGSAIWSDSEPEDYICTFQIHNSPDNISMIFKNNKGKSIIHASPMYNCYMSHMDGEYDLSYIYHQIFNFTSNPSIYNNISSKPEHLYFCDKLNQVNLTCKHKQIQKKFYPGQTLSVFVAALDGANKSVGALVLDLNETTHTTGHTVQQDESLTMCHQIIIDILPTKERCSSNDTSLGYCIHKLHLSLKDSFEILELKLLVYPCPVGFMFDSNTHTCRCSSLLMSQNKYIICNISDTSISIPPDSNLWIGPLTSPHNDTDRPPLAVICNCPVEFCDPFKNSWNILTETWCLPSRTALFCSQCADNKSVVFGSDACYECSNYWLFTIIGYALAGILLIYILFKLQLTLTHGTINSLIFFSQLANTGPISILKMASDKAYFSQFSLIFLSTLNLNLGYKLCFYNGMTEVVKSGLLFVFPFYLLGLLLIIQSVSHQSSRVSHIIYRNATQVLATVIHLSFLRLLTNTIDIISPVTIYVEGYPNTVAWYLDATIHYTDTSHVVLLSLALLSICAFIVPYILLLLFPKLWLRFRIINKYCKPFVDAILAPYRENQCHWFSLRLILQVQMCIVFACYRGSSYSSVATINGSILIAFSFIHCVCHPFKSRYLNILDTWFALIGCAIFAFYHFFYIQNYIMFSNVMVLLVFLTFLGILLYHFLLVRGKLGWALFIKHHILQILSHCFGNATSTAHGNMFNYGSCNVREPLLE